MMCRGVRGATTVEVDEPEAVLAATHELFAMLIHANQIHSEDVASIIFTTTADICSVYPAKGARQLGWVDVPLICTQEMPVVGSLTRCIRILLHWNTAKPQKDIQHVFLHGATVLRPDIHSDFSGEIRKLASEWVVKKLENQ
ncbi:MAG: chorismate mutase [Chloroflexota bacterium]